MKAAIVCDNWKLPIYRRVLKQAGYEWEEKPLTKDFTSMFVVTDDLDALHMVVRTCQAQAQRRKQRKR